MGNLEQQGFEIIQDYFDPGAVSLLATAIGHSPIYRSRAGMRHALEVDTVRSLACDTGLLRLARNALGDAAVPYRATLFDKSLESNWLVVWHQDKALPLRERRDISGWGPWSVKEGVNCAHAPASALEQVLAIRVHLDHSTTENGPLKVLPGTHALGVLSDEAIHELVEKTSPVECHVRSGGLLLMKPLLVHASSKATSSTPRRVLHIEYSARSYFEGGLQLSIPSGASPSG